MDLSPEQKKKIKKTKLSKSTAAQKLPKEAILNRMSSGKKRPKSEAKIKKDKMKTPSKDDLVAKKLFFQDGSNDDEGDKDLLQSPVKSKTVSKMGGEGVSKMSNSTKKLRSSTSKWQVSKGTPSFQKEKAGEDQEEKILRKSGRKKKKMTTDEEVEVEDVEIDFPILKRKSLGLEEFKAALSRQESPQKEQKVAKVIIENGQSTKKQKKKKKVTDETVSGDEPSKENVEKSEGDDKGKKKKSKKRGKKRKRSTSESGEPQAKKEKPGREGFAVRCGNLPVGVGKEALRMFIGEADVFPTHIILKRKKKSAAGEKKQFVTYATIICSTADEAEKLCRLNGISMPSPLRGKDCKLLIHMLNDDNSNEDPTFKRKLFVSNLHPKLKEDEVMAFFETSDCNPTNVILPKKGNDKTSRGYAFVWLTSGGDVDRALKLKNPTLRDKIVTIARSHRHPGKQEP
eukprot:XP_003727759.1 PREDICTED: nucleolin [Strongylocentrotus purpuratus]